MIMDINYLSDDEKQNHMKSIKYENNDYNDYLPYNSDNDEEIDEEELEFLKQQNIIIMDAIHKKSFDTYTYTQFDKDIKEKKIEKLQEKKSMNVNDFNNYVNKIIQEKQPKKFVSNRFLDKKKLIDSKSIDQSIDLKNIRKFNPRLPPYFEVYPKYTKY